MQIIYIKEEKRYSKSELKTKLNYEKKEEELDKFIKKLEELNIIILVKENNEYKYKFSYVGIIYYKNLIFVYPKYISIEISDKKRFYRKFINILKYYIKKEDIDQEKLFIIDSIKNNNEIKNNYFDLIFEILEYYYEYGLYQSDKKTYEVNGNGNIDWTKTINEKNGYSINNKIHYLEYLTKEKKKNREYIIRKIQKNILTEIFEFFSEIDLIDFLGSNPVYFKKNNIANYSNQYIISILNLELGQVFNDNKIRLLELLKKYYSDYKEKFNNNLLLFGTTSFNIFWEKICQRVLKNDYESIIDIIEKKRKPSWNIKGEDDFLSGSPLKPDLLIYKSISDEKHFIILDAKYYSIEEFSESGNNLPNTSDISKQHVYEMQFKELVDDNKFYNIFIFPSSKNEIINFGTVHLEYMTSYNINNIKLILLPSDKIYDYYINDSDVDKKLLRKIIETF